MLHEKAHRHLHNHIDREFYSAALFGLAQLLQGEGKTKPMP